MRVIKVQTEDVYKIKNDIFLCLYPIDTKMELHYIGATWCKACTLVKPRAKNLAENEKISFIELDFDSLSETEQASITKLPTLRLKNKGVLVKEFITASAASQLELYLHPNEEF
jgi:thiol-disulfide isomerase/thioredoxin